MNPLRLTRLRKTDVIRHMLTETRLHTSELIAPLFISEKLSKKEAIASMPGQFQWSLQDVMEEIESLLKLGIRAVLLFGVPLSKDAMGQSALRQNGIVQNATRLIKKHYPEMLVITDLCFCEYTDHGHCGALSGDKIDIEKTHHLLKEQAKSHAEAGADWIAPSGMIDGMVGAIRNGLDEAGFTETAILSYSVKYASTLYGPFRDALEGTPQFGDRKSYQMNPANAHEALREAILDVQEGADLLMVKPALFYLDIIRMLKDHFKEVPLAAYQVSGEYAMLKHGAREGAFDEKTAVLESLIAIKRAGADCIITYFAKNVAEWLA